MWGILYYRYSGKCVAHFFAHFFDIQIIDFQLSLEYTVNHSTFLRLLKWRCSFVIELFITFIEEINL